MVDRILETLRVISEQELSHNETCNGERQFNRLSLVTGSSLDRADVKTARLKIDFGMPEAPIIQNGDIEESLNLDYSIWSIVHLLGPTPCNHTYIATTFLRML